jgi:hypothetical protein
MEKNIILNTLRKDKNNNNDNNSKHLPSFWYCRCLKLRDFGVQNFLCRHCWEVGCAL